MNDETKRTLTVVAKYHQRQRPVPVMYLGPGRYGLAAEVVDPEGRPRWQLTAIGLESAEDARVMAEYAMSVPPSAEVVASWNGATLVRIVPVSVVDTVSLTALPTFPDIEK